MLSSLPDIAPRDAHNLWYTSNHQSNYNVIAQESAVQASDLLGPQAIGPQSAAAYAQRRSQHAGYSRTPLARLRADELYMDRRKQNVQNYGSSWIKPPGIFKSLHQLREEQRELEEQREAMRREQLAQELAEAEAEAAAEAGDDQMHEEGADEEMALGRDLDDDIPEGDITGLGGNGSDDDELENDAAETSRGVPAQRTHNDTYREVLARGGEALSNPYMEERGLDSDDDNQSQLLQEDDLLHEDGQSDVADGMDMGMNVDLDNDVPEAEQGEYEHTDTEAEMTSSDDEDSIDMDRWPPTHHLATSMVRSDGTQHSLDVGNMAPQRDSPRHSDVHGRP